MKDSYRQSGEVTKTLYQAKEKKLVEQITAMDEDFANLLSFRGWQWVYLADHLTIANQMTPD